MIIAGIGARATPPDVLLQMKEIGALCRSLRHFVRSGHAAGADFAFESGAQERCIAYLPWNGFNPGLTSKAVLRVPTRWAELMEVAQKFHPAWDRLSQGAQKLMARNVCQMLGENMDRPTDLVICWTKDGGATGGTGQAIRMANHYGVPVLNLFNTTYEGVVQYLTRMK